MLKQGYVRMFRREAILIAEVAYRDRWCFLGEFMYLTVAANHGPGPQGRINNQYFHSSEVEGQQLSDHKSRGSNHGNGFQTRRKASSLGIKLRYPGVGGIS